ncbi:hypothetical protein OUZ56_015892 [Daphnia magna]|uniref:Uncharacterized protein n=1 Tax=Daphnia magna TaxID=35525 RepID=A0ABR0AP12_9CRUS|nr:hypothetical protein OUZ56_015892 [Daphnia magna]
MDIEEGPTTHRRGRWTSRIAVGATRTSPWILRRAPPPTEEGAGHRGFFFYVSRRAPPPTEEGAGHRGGSPLELLERRRGPHHTEEDAEHRGSPPDTEDRRPAPRFTPIRTPKKKEDGTVEYCQIGIPLLHFIL